MLGACVTNGRQFTQLAHLLALAKLDQNDIKTKDENPSSICSIAYCVTLGNSRPSSEWNGKQNDNRLKTNNVCRILFRPFCYLLSDSAVDFAVRSWPYSSFAPPPHLPIQPDAATMHACAVCRVCVHANRGCPEWIYSDVILRVHNIFFYCFFAQLVPLSADRLFHRMVQTTQGSE